MIVYTKHLTLPELADGDDGGYRFNLKIEKGKYSIQATPSYYDYSYYIDQSGIIRAATMPKVAGPDDPPVTGSYTPPSQTSAR
jgi:hypothetical protein